MGATTWATVAGMGATCSSPYVGSLISASHPRTSPTAGEGILPLLLSFVGIIASVIGALIIRAERAQGRTRRKTGEYSATALVIIAALVCSQTFFGNLRAAMARDRRPVCGRAHRASAEV